ncbi:Hypothetical_protein [Hexamita inflata]|uniref:Hypothetical_protein n=1 Tax=Hexamita inflata TaxID=28002 RepID=A0ABP1JZL1_9EUKA
MQNVVHDQQLLTLASLIYNKLFNSDLSNQFLIYSITVLDDAAYSHFWSQLSAFSEIPQNTLKALFQPLQTHYLTTKNITSSPTMDFKFRKSVNRKQLSESFYDILQILRQDHLRPSLVKITLDHFQTTFCSFSSKQGQKVIQRQGYSQVSHFIWLKISQIKFSPDNLKQYSNIHIKSIQPQQPLFVSFYKQLKIIFVYV